MFVIAFLLQFEAAVQEFGWIGGYLAHEDGPCGLIGWLLLLVFGRPFRFFATVDIGSYFVGGAVAEFG